jgi:hypothetical protein
MLPDQANQVQAHFRPPLPIDAKDACLFHHISESRRIRNEFATRRINSWSTPSIEISTFGRLRLKRQVKLPSRARGNLRLIIAVCRSCHGCKDIGSLSLAGNALS